MSANYTKVVTVENVGLEVGVASDWETQGRVASEEAACKLGRAKEETRPGSQHFSDFLRTWWWRCHMWCAAYSVLSLWIHTWPTTLLSPFSHAQETPASAPSQPWLCPLLFSGVLLPPFLGDCLVYARIYVVLRQRRQADLLDRTVQCLSVRPASPNRWASWSGRRRPASQPCVQQCMLCLFCPSDTHLPPLTCRYWLGLGGNPISTVRWQSSLEHPFWACSASFQSHHCPQWEGCSDITQVWNFSVAALPFTAAGFPGIAFWPDHSHQESLGVCWNFFSFLDLPLCHGASSWWNGMLMAHFVRSFEALKRKFIEIFQLLGL